MTLTLWHNPRCRKSREAKQLLDDKGVEFEVREYLNEVPTVEELRVVLAKLGFDTARDWMRTKEADYRALSLKDETDETKLLEAMVSHPKLIERPVLISDDKAALGRPPEKVLGIL
ncbi:arsenate reductase (glutaredoxin) [Hyphobacterium sp.]|uniref:arsenate reductase (glutaredoxin) n=1 Tax=Hyphobacterium sp. TaxID=2004662 RepID=UPI003BA9D6EA